MENGWNVFSNSSSGGRGQNGNWTNRAWDIWELGTSRFDWTTYHNSFNNEEDTTATVETTAAAAAASFVHPEAGAVHALLFSHQGNNGHHDSSSSPLYNAGGDSHCLPDPHLMCLKLGKRHYFENTSALGDEHVAGFSVTKRGKPYYYSGGGEGPSTSIAPAMVPRCQVEGCQVALLNAKDYHRRHKVCEMHSKAPKVVVLGLEQRFCQQCSRFHAVGEFDESKRSCRRRLAGHNERRRKSSHIDHSLARSSSQGSALSLLSSKRDSWMSSAADLSSRCSAALRELVAENRAAILARQLILDRSDWQWHHHPTEDLNVIQNKSNSLVPHHLQMLTGSHSWDRLNEAGTPLTLDLMQAPNSACGLFSVREWSKEEQEEECSELWSSLGGGAHLV